MPVLRVDIIGMPPHNPAMAGKTPIRIRGIEYDSVSAAARALGVGQTTVSSAIKRGYLDRVGLRGSSGDIRKPVKIRGVAYASIGEAAKSLGVAKQVVQAAIKLGTEDLVGLGPREYGNAATPVTIRGVEYPSQSIAAQILYHRPS
jgi:hypothetical protein